MSKPIVFYFIMAILFLSMNGGAYFVFFASSLEEYKSQESEIEAKKLQAKSIQKDQEEIQKYKVLEKLYLANNAFYEKWIRKEVSKTEIKVYLHEIGKAIGVNIEPEEKKIEISAAEMLPYKTINYEINTYFTVEQLKSFLNKLINNNERLFLIKILEAKAVSADELFSNLGKADEKEKYMLVKLSLEYVYLLPPEEK